MSDSAIPALCAPVVLTSTPDLGKSAFVNRGTTADIWLVETPDSKYISKTVRLSPDLLSPARSQLYDNAGSAQLEDPVQRFVQDFRSRTAQWMALQHQNIVKVFGLTENLDLRVEFCANGTARQYLKCHQDSHREKLMIRDIIQGMVYLHSQSPAVVHGSLKTDRVFIAEDGTAKIGEFGLSSLTWSFALLAPSISHAGSSRWMSPELIKFNPDLGTPIPTTASDIWALGCVFMEILFGEIPYKQHKHELKVMSAIARGEKPGFVTSNASEEFPGMWSILEQCWTVLPDSRPTAAAVQQAIQLIDSSADDAVTDHAALVDSSPATTMYPPAPHQKRSRSSSPSTNRSLPVVHPSFIPGVATEDPKVATGGPIHPDKPRMFSELGAAHCHRFERLGTFDDLNEATSCWEQAVMLTPDDHPDKPHRLGELGAVYHHRFERLGLLDDLDKAVSYQERAVILAPDGHPDKPHQLGNLGVAYRCLFERLGRLDDLDKAINCQEQAVMLTPDGHPDKPHQLGELGTTYRCLFERLGRLGDLDKATNCLEQAVILTPDRHPDKPHRLGNLGVAYRCLFEHFGNLDDLHKATSCLEQAVLLTPDGRPDKPHQLGELGTTCRCLFEHLGRLDDLHKATSYLEQAVTLTPDGHPDKPHQLGELGTTYRCLFEHLGRLDDLDKATNCQEQAVVLIPDGHPDKQRWLGELGAIRHLLFERSGSLGDLDKAASGIERTVTPTPDGHPDKPR